MENLNLFYKYITRPLFLIKFPKIIDLIEFSNFFIKKVRLNMFLLAIKQNYYLYLYNICILVRLIFNKYLFIKKVNKGYTLNKICIQMSLEGIQISIFLDIFGNILLPTFENFNMGLKDNNFDIFGNYEFIFNYCDPVFTSKNYILIWSIANRVQIIFYFLSKNKEQNMLLLRYLNMKYNILK